MDTYTVFAVPKDRDDDMTDGRGLPILKSASFDAAIDYVSRNDSPDNPDHYMVRSDEDGQEVW